jgi:hypothetical protein
MRKLWFALLISIVVAAIVGLTGRIVLPHSGKALGTIDPADIATPSPTASAKPNLPPSVIVTANSVHLRFVGKQLDTRLWATCYPWEKGPLGCTNFGNKHEMEWYKPSQDRVYQGYLHLVATRTPTKGKNSKGGRKWYVCRSGMVTTYPSFDFEYGTVTVVAQIPNNPGLWSGLWLAPEDYKVSTPEIDILEHWGEMKNGTGVFFHPGLGVNTVGEHPKIKRPIFKTWNTYTLRWTPTELEWFINKRKVWTVTNFIPSQPMYFIADLADLHARQAGGCSGSLLIKSVEIRSRDVTHPIARHRRRHRPISSRAHK